MKRQLAVDHFKLISKICWHYWPRVPLVVRAYMDIEDVIADCCTLVTMKQRKYCKQRGRETTFVSAVTHNYCRSLIIQNLYIKKRRAVAFLSLSDPDLKLTTFCSELDWLRAKQPIERIMQDASSNLRRHFQSFLDQRRFNVFSSSDLEEFRHLARRHRASYGDLRMVLVQC